MINQVTYTIIVPYHNMPERLERLLNSIPLRRDLQVIVIDDCSDKNLDLYEALKTKFIWVEFYKNDINGGAGKARNKGLDNAKGKYILFADSDDFFNPSLNYILDLYKDSDYDIVYFFTTCLNENTYQNSNYLSYLNGLLKKALNNGFKTLKYSTPYPWSKLIKSELIKSNSIRFQESKVSNDVKFSTLLDFYSKKIKIDETAIYCYIYNTVSVSRSINIEKMEERLKIDIWRWNFIKEQKITYIPMSKILGPVMERVCQINNKTLFKIAKKTFENSNLSSFSFWFLILRYKFKKLVK